MIAHHPATRSVALRTMLRWRELTDAARHPLGISPCECHDDGQTTHWVSDGPGTVDDELPLDVPICVTGCPACAPKEA